MNLVCHLDVWIINFINERKICESRRKYACVCKGVIVLLFILFYFIFRDRDYSSVYGDTLRIFIRSIFVLL